MNRLDRTTKFLLVFLVLGVWGLLFHFVLTPTSSWAQLDSIQSGQGRIAFHSNRDGNDEIYVMKADGSNQINLTNHPSGDGWPAWSFDGSKIAFRSFRDGRAEVYIMKADGSNQTNLTNHPADDGTPDWSPDDSRIAFYSRRDGNWEVYVMKADGSNQINLTNHSADDWAPDWSPDGSKIAFHSNRDGNFEIYVMQADGSNPVRLTNNSADDYSPAWSPDGSRIAFTSYRGGNFEIYVMQADGSNPVRLTNNSAIDEWPTWSPDGNKIAFDSDRDGNKEIYAMDALDLDGDGNGDNLVNLTNSPSSDDLIADWSPPCATDVTTRVSIFRIWLYRSRKPGRNRQVVALRNTTGNPIQGPVSLVLDNLSGHAKLVNKSGITTCVAPLRSPYISVNVGKDNVLRMGERAIVVLEFSNPSRQPITYNPRVLAGSGDR